MHARFEGIQNDGRENRDWAEEERPMIPAVTGDKRTLEADGYSIADGRCQVATLVSNVSPHPRDFILKGENAATGS